MASNFSELSTCMPHEGFLTEPPAALRPTVDLRRSPSPNAMVKKQFNNPGGLYSTENKQKQQQLIAGPEKKSEG